MARSLWLFVVLLASSAIAAPPDGGQLAKACATRDGWSDPATPAQLSANTWYVGPCGITVLLVTSSHGRFLIDAGPAEVQPRSCSRTSRRWASADRRTNGAPSSARIRSRLQRTHYP
jgi:hypothetical protein